MADLWQDEVVPPYARIYDLFVALAWAAAVTERLLLGTGICLIPERDPITTTKQVASVDVLSGGRLLFGVGAGSVPEETANHGVDPARRWSVMNERIEAMRRIWTQDEAEFHGEHVDFGPIYSWPKPAQRPYPPILVGGEGKGVVRRVLAYGDERMPEGRAPVEVLAPRIARLHEACAAGRGDSIPVTVFNPPARRDYLERLRQAGVGRVVLMAPSADAGEVERVLDQFGPLVDALSPIAVRNVARRPFGVIDEATGRYFADPTGRDPRELCRLVERLAVPLHQLSPVA